jgi:hypothetical protein
LILDSIFIAFVGLSEEFQVSFLFCLAASFSGIMDEDRAVHIVSTHYNTSLANLA